MKTLITDALFQSIAFITSDGCPYRKDSLLPACKYKLNPNEKAKNMLFVDHSNISH